MFYVLSFFYVDFFNYYSNFEGGSINFIFIDVIKLVFDLEFFFFLVILVFLLFNF